MRKNPRYLLFPGLRSFLFKKSTHVGLKVNPDDSFLMLPVRSIHPFIEYLDWCGWINCHIVRNWSSYCSTSCPWSWCHVLVCFIWATDRRWENCKLWGTLMHFPTQRITCCRRPFLGPLVHTSPYVMHNFFFLFILDIEYISYWWDPIVLYLTHHSKVAYFRAHKLEFIFFSVL